MPEKIISSNVDGVRNRKEKSHVSYNGNDELPKTDESCVHKDINTRTLTNNLQEIKSSFIKQVDTQLGELIDDILSESTLHTNEEESTKSSQEKKKKVESSILPDKEFIIRDSLLTLLLKDNHIQTIYNIFVSVLMLLFINSVIYDVIETGRPKLDFSMMKYAFGKSQLVLSTWIFMKLSLLLLLFPTFHYWAHRRQSWHVKKSMDYTFLCLYVIYLCAFLILPVRIIVNEAIPPASTVIILCEQVRLIMKAHAFVRENIPRALKYKLNKESNKEANTPCPDFGKFLYFLFVPTLIYRDHYPRTPCIRWNYVTSNFVQVIACMFYIYYIFERFCVPVFHRFGHEKFTAQSFVISVFGCMMPGALVLLITFFAILHAWMNAFAEMLKFGDRMFYKDWWNSRTFANYYRTWNMVVHDWLYTYIYKDLCILLGTNRTGPLFIVFILSAVVHEYILSFAFRFFYPVLFIMFGVFGVFFLFLTNKRSARSWNVFVWTSLFIGTGLLMSLYSMEWYARINCPPHKNAYLDIIIPRSWTCDIYF